MSQGQTVKGKAASGQLVELLVDDTGQLFIANPGGGGSSGVVGIRQDADTPYAADGQPHPLLFNELGRLKTAGAPAQFTPVITAVSAIQAVINTPVASATAFADVTQASNVMAYVTGTFAGMNCTFEGSLDSTNGTDGTWFGIQAIRSNANTVELTTGVLAAAPIYAWEMSVNALSFMRVRCTARTSGTMNWVFRLGSYATEPIPGAQVTGTQVVSLASIPLAPSASFGSGSFVNIISAATTNSTLVKATVGNVNDMSISNNGATPVYVKIYGKATAPTVGTDVPIRTIMCPANGFVQIGFGSYGIRPLLGIGVGITGGIANTDTTAVALNQVALGISYT